MGRSLIALMQVSVCSTAEVVPPCNIVGSEFCEALLADRQEDR